MAPERQSGFSRDLKLRPGVFLSPKFFSLSASSHHAHLNTSCSVTCQEGSPPPAIVLWCLASRQGQTTCNNTAPPCRVELRDSLAAQNAVPRESGQFVPENALRTCVPRVQPSRAHPHRRALPPTNVRFRPLCGHPWQEVNPKALVSPRKRMRSPCVLDGLTLHRIQYCNTEATPMGRLVAKGREVALEGSDTFQRTQGRCK